MDIFMDIAFLGLKNKKILGSQHLGNPVFIRLAVDRT